MESKNIVWRPSPTVCRCCFNDGCYKDISTEYFWMGKREIYSEMLTDTLDVSISYSQSGGPNSNSRLICEPCIARLRDASDFKKQVLECEKMFLLQLNPDNDSVPSEELGTNESQMKTEEVKIEKLTSVEDFPDSVDFGGTQGEDNVDDDDDLDDEPLTKLASKIPKKEKVDLMDLVDNVKATEKRKSSSKAKSSPAKKAKTKSKTEAAQPSSSGSKVVPKKQKGDVVTTASVHTEQYQVVNETILSEDCATNYNSRRARRNNFIIILECSNVCPFKWMKNLYLCFYCDEYFPDPSDLRDHNFKDHHSISAQQIKVASRRLKKHELGKVDVTNFNCKLCSEFVQDFTNLKLHIQAKHNINFDNNTSDGILPFKLNKSNHQCYLCEEKYDDFKSLNQHMNFHFQNFICEQCGSGFITPERLRSHTYSHSTGSINCDSCDKVFKSMNAKNEHFAMIHLQVKRHRCPHCPETFRNYFQRTKHITGVHGLKTKEFKCSLCPKVFLLSGKLGHHVRAVHMKVKNHACHICEWKFYSKTELKDHMVRHGGEKKFQCLVCKKAYARKYTLREHMRIHDNDRRFTCTICGIGFVHKCGLKQHLKVHQ